MSDDVVRYHRVTLRKIETEVFEIYGAESDLDAQRILTEYCTKTIGAGRPPHIVRTGEEHTEFEVTARTLYARVSTDGGGA